MLPIRLRIKNVGPYVDETINFHELEGSVVAIIGENGAGKTMLVDSVFASLYRSLPSRDSIYKFCRGKDAGYEFEFMINGIRHRTEVKINVSGKSREMESWIFIENGTGEFKALNDGKNSTFDNEVRALIGPPEVALASVFAAQNRAGSFLSLPKAKRKELFIDLLGLGKLQVISERASEKERECQELYNGLHKEVSGLKEEANQVTDLDSMYKKLEDIRGEVGVAEVDIKLHAYEVGLLKGKASILQEVQQRLTPIRARKERLTKDLADTTAAVANVQRQADRIEAYRAAVEAGDYAAKELSDLRMEIGELSGKVGDHHKKVAEYNAVVGAHKAGIAECTKNSALAEKDLKRAKADSAIINTVPCHAEGECANCEFLVNAIKQRDAVDALQGEIDEAKASILNLEGKIKQEVRPHGEQLAIIEARLKEQQAKAQAHDAQVVLSNNAKAHLASAEAAALSVVDLRARLDRIQTELAEVEAEIQAINNELKIAQESADNYKKAETALELEQEHLNGLRVDMQNYVAEIAKAESNQGRALRAKADLDNKLPLLAKHDKDRKEWNLLAKAFSKTGIQSLEIDVAGPAVSGITNDLLLGCFGPRFSVRFVTQVQKDDKSGYKDDFDIYVTDADDDNRESSIDDLSGGEKVIVCEAVGLAISLFNRSRASVGWASLWRDEASSAVDDRRAPIYIDMLRRARELGHYEKLYFIAHQQRVTENADSMIKVVKGKIFLE